MNNSACHTHNVLNIYEYGYGQWSFVSAEKYAKLMSIISQNKSTRTFTLYNVHCICASHSFH